MLLLVFHFGRILAASVEMVKLTATLVQGPIYQRVINAVIEASRNDFEENGVSTAVLESMQEVSYIAQTSSLQRCRLSAARSAPPCSEALAAIEFTVRRKEDGSGKKEWPENESQRIISAAKMLPVRKVGWESEEL